MGKLAPYLQKKMRPILFMGSDKNVISSKTIAAINKMMIEVEATPTTTKKALEVSISGDTIPIGQRTIIVNIDDNPFVSSDQPKPHYEVSQDQLRLNEEDKRQLEEEKKKIEEAKLKLLEEEKKQKEEEKRRGEEKEKKEKERK